MARSFSLSKITLKEWNFNTQENYIQLKYIHQLPVIPSTELELTYIVQGNGDIKIEVNYKGVNGLPELPLDLNYQKAMQTLNTMEKDLLKTI